MLSVHYGKVHGYVIHRLSKLRITSFLMTLKYFQEVGWLNSVREGLPVDRNMSPIPWITYAALSFLENRIKSQFKVFEFESGNSTLWWASRVSKVVSCEHDLTWYEIMRQKLPANVQYSYQKLEYGGAYSKTIKSFVKEFDIVIIDGRDRVNCAKNSLEALTDSGIIIWDNADRHCYKDGYDFLRAAGMKRIDFVGIGPMANKSWCTSIFYRAANCLDI